MNELDRALVALGRSKSALPDLMRELREGDLWFLLPYHPELEGEAMELKSGMQLPFSMLQEGEDIVVPIFSSSERLDESLQTAKIPALTYCAGCMPAQQMLEILGKAELCAVLNKSCHTGQMVIPPDMMRDVADGSALKPPNSPTTREKGTVRAVDPADYPTDLLQAVFESLRQHRQFLAAWIFEDVVEQPLPAGGRRFRFMILMDPRDALIFHDFNLVANSAHNEEDQVALCYAEEKDPEFVSLLWKTAMPFYTAPGYERPEIEAE